MNKTTPSAYFFCFLHFSLVSAPSLQFSPSGCQLSHCFFPVSIFIHFLSFVYSLSFSAFPLNFLSLRFFGISKHFLSSIPYHCLSYHDYHFCVISSYETWFQLKNSINYAVYQSSCLSLHPSICISIVSIVIFPESEIAFAAIRPSPMDTETISKLSRYLRTVCPIYFNLM